MNYWDEKDMYNEMRDAGRKHRLDILKMEKEDPEMAEKIKFQELMDYMKKHNIK